MNYDYNTLPMNPNPSLPNWMRERKYKFISHSTQDVQFIIANNPEEAWSLLSDSIEDYKEYEMCS